MQRIATFNINGIRAAHRRGFTCWLQERNCDVIALQEVRASLEVLPTNAFGPYYTAYNPGTLPGRNGVAILTKQPPEDVRTWNLTHPATIFTPNNGEADSYPTPQRESSPTHLARELKKFIHEGRWIEVDLAEAPITVISLYVPKGGLPAELQRPGNSREPMDGGAKHLRKMDFLTGLDRQLTRARRQAKARGRELLVMGDFNIAHENWDVTNWRANRRSEGFLPIEREWLSKILSPRKFIDVIRHRHGPTPGPYSWWSWRGQSFTKDVGWRIDYHLATPKLAETAVNDTTDKDSSPDSRISDHCPVIIDYAI
ncbi:Exodeoxyribonuclease [Dermatophilus congolensis]|uniref:Exodeoxyribonuclease n=1 Tax=Dermatophilus congolensis TaxID=1863 RepID=A0AA46GZX5_9MICO|nr:exodeoxyribonuclease III [Dermatophilus congolensis]STD06171.1 Exodeoxyribonuclease [Dermatophilus congolensis]